MKVAIVGSRQYPKLDDVTAYVNTLDKSDVIVSGGAHGVDTVAVLAARARGMEVLVFDADWPRFGRSAGMIRNVEIVKAADRVVAFWDGRSRGTQHTMDVAMQRKVPLTTFIEKLVRKPTRETNWKEPK